MKFKDILGTIGNTPVVRINKLGPKNVKLYVKVEAFNPLGSVKDRLALGVIEAAEKSGRAEAGPDRDRGHQRQYRHRPGHGLRGQGLSAGGHHGRELFSVERRKLMRFLGAKVVLTPAARARQRHDPQGRRAGRRRMAGSRPASSRTRPTPTCTRGPPLSEILARFRRRAKLGLLGHRLWHRRHPERRRPGAAPRSAEHQDHRRRARAARRC